MSADDIRGFCQTASARRVSDTHLQTGVDTVVGCRGYRDVLRRTVDGFRDAVRIGKDAEASHRQRNRLVDEDYARPGLTIEIPLLWGTF